MKFKKIYLSLILLLSLFLTGCFETSVVPNEESVKLTLTSDYQKVINLGEKLPDFTFKFEGNLNTVKNSRKEYYAVFSHNEDIILSDALNNLFEQYKDRMFVLQTGSDKVSTTLFSTLNKYGKVENVEYTPDDHKVYEETAYISLENGLKLSIDYRRFIYNGKNMYSWKYSSAISMFLYYPMMAVAEGNKNRLMLITLPNGVKFHVGPDLILDKVLNSASYADGKDCVYYTFEYFMDPSHTLKEGEKDFPLEEKEQVVIDYYVNNFDAKYNAEKKMLFYNYLGNDFSVELLEKGFKMHYVEPHDHPDA